MVVTIAKVQRKRMIHLGACILKQFGAELILQEIIAEPLIHEQGQALLCICNQLHGVILPPLLLISPSRPKTPSGPRARVGATIGEKADTLR